MATRLGENRLVKSWSELKERLFVGPECRNSDQLREAFIDELQIPRSQLEPHRFNPLLLVRHLEKLGQICQSCLSLRKEIRELEILAVKSLADYDLFKETAALDETAERLRLHLGAMRSEKTQQAAARDRFGDREAIEGGLSLVADAQCMRLDGEIDDAEKLSGIMTQRWNALKAYQKEYATRYNEEGNAHNYGERALNLHRILRQEYSEAAERALALQIGLKTVYGWDVGSLPDVFTLKGLDDFVVWALEARRGSGWRMESESTFDVVVPLVQPWELGASERGLVSSDDFKQALRNPNNKPIALKFDVPATVFMNKAVRLRGFGLAFGNKFKLVPGTGIDSIQTEDGFIRILAAVKPPNQALADGQDRSIEELVLGNVCLHQAAQPAAYTEDPSIQNIAPIGAWTIILHPNAVWKEDKKRRLSDGGQEDPNPIRDLKLFFRVVVPNISGRRI